MFPELILSYLFSPRHSPAIKAIHPPSVPYAMTPLISPTTNEKEQDSVQESSSFAIKVFSRRDLQEQPFLPELLEVINTSYRDHINKIGVRLQADTQIVDELGDGGFTAIATASGEIVGTASVKAWKPNAEGIVWNSPGYYDGKSADDVLSMRSASPIVPTSSVETVSCEGDFEVFLVAVKLGVQYRKRGIAEGLLKACQEELKRRFKTGQTQPSGKTCLRIMLKVVSEINGAYWLKKGYHVVGECWCPPFTWDLKKAFILWAMRKDLIIN